MTRGSSSSHTTSSNGSGQTEAGNCDRNATGRRSSFHESLIPMHGLYEYGEHAAASRTAELLLDHRLFRSKTTGEPIHES